MIHPNASYPELVAAIDRVHTAYMALPAEDPVKDSLRFQYQALLEKEEQYFGLESAPAEEEEIPKKKKRKLSKATREKMSQLMKNRQEVLRNARANKKAA